jgi:hypothetical protein
MGIDTSHDRLDLFGICGIDTGFLGDIKLVFLVNCGIDTSFLGDVGTTLLLFLGDGGTTMLFFLGEGGTTFFLGDSGIRGVFFDDGRAAFSDVNLCIRGEGTGIFFLGDGTGICFVCEIRVCFLGDAAGIGIGILEDIKDAV